MDGFGYGGSSGSSYPYWKPPSHPSSNPSASAPPFMMDHPVEPYGPMEELSSPMNFYGYSHRSPADWPYRSVLPGASSTSSIYADNTGPGSCGSRFEDSYKGMFSPNDMFTAWEVSSGSAALANENLYGKRHAYFAPTYNPATLIPGSSSTILHIQEPSIHPQHAIYNDFGIEKAGFSYPVEPSINDNNNNNNPALPLLSLGTRASIDAAPFPNKDSVSKEAGDNYLGGQARLQSSSCISPINFDALLGSSGHSKPFAAAGPGVHNPPLDPSYWRGSHASHSPVFDYKSSDSLLDNKPVESSCPFPYQMPNASVDDMDKDGDEHSLKNASENSKANPKPSRSSEEKLSEDRMNVEKGTVLLTDLDLKQKTSESDVSKSGSSVLNAMHYLSELLVCECSNGSRLQRKELETIEEVVKNLTKCLNKNGKCKTEDGEASQQKQSMSNTLYGGVAMKETVNTDEITQNIKNVLASNFPDVNDIPPQALLFKNLWLEAEAALCSTTYMSRFHRICNEMEKDKSDNKVSSLNTHKSVPIAKDPAPQTSDSLVEEERHENNDVKVNLTRSMGFSSDSVDALLASIYGSFSDVGKIPSAIPEEAPISTTHSHVSDVVDSFQILKHREAKYDFDSDNAILQKDKDEQRGQLSETPTHYSRDDQKAPDVMKRFQILKRREVEQEQRCLNELDSVSDKDVGSTGTGKTDTSRAQEDNLEDAVMSRLCVLNSRAGHLSSEKCVDGEENGSEHSGRIRGNESPSDWEHVLQDDEERG